MPILPPLPRPQRRRIHKIIHATRDKGHARRLMAILLLHEGRTITDVHHLTGAARSTIGRWLRWYRDEGIDALEALPAGRAPVLPIAKIVTLLVLLMQFSPQDFGYQRSRWCTELLAIKINRLTGLNVAASTLRRWLPRMGIVWRRPVPTLRIKDPAYQEKMANIDAALARCDADNPVFYEDEVDIDLNPKLGADWMFRAQQKRVVTPGQNAKHYLAGVLHAGNGRVLYVSGIKKNSSLFIAMLEKLRHHYRRAKTITLILDNYIIHKSKQTERWLKKNPKFCLVFQPVYSPWVNHIERLWHKLHETITRNHQCRGMANLLARVKHFMDTVSPFPGNGYGTAKASAWRLRCGSMRSPVHAKRSHTCSRKTASFSPMPPLKAIKSSPPKQAVSAPVSRITRWVNWSMARVASALPCAASPRRVRISAEMPDTPNRPDSL